MLSLRELPVERVDVDLAAGAPKTPESLAKNRFGPVPAIEEALFILMRSYEALGMPQLAADSRRVMEKTYPSSQYLSRGFKTSQDPWWKFW